MEKRGHAGPAHQRPALVDATMRANNAAGQPAHSPRRSHKQSQQAENREPSRTHHEHLKVPGRAAPASANPRMVAVTAAGGARATSASAAALAAAELKRISQVSATSNTSTNSSGFRKLKTHVGPWELGRTLGKGSSARVRFGRHVHKRNHVAIKIISKSVCHITQAGSLAKLSEIESALPDNVDGIRRMPLSLEREVAILKLIDHPNIVQLHDIWESRNEIYLIMEYVEGGDLFEFIRKYGPLPEELAVGVFRQIMAAVQYCHSYGICHRDLKPENILLKEDYTVKIADFGMAALHQGPQERLRTSCGSPHYAAPELLRSRSYRGEKTDIWSMGVILYAMMAGRLPFDDEDMHVMLSKAKKGIYEMAPEFSSDAKDFIHRILQVNPDVRISMRDMWERPLIWKYGYLDQLGSNEGLDDPRLQNKSVPLNLSSIDAQILRQLRAMWHSFPEQQLVAKLVSNEPNDQKLFYWLLHDYRDRQLEDYNPGLTHSESDYHHLRPPQWSTRVSTRKFSTSRGNGHGRSISRFTVISNVADTEVGAELGTVRSYDPYKPSSVVMRPQATHAKIVVHRDTPDSALRMLSAGSSVGFRGRVSSDSRRRSRVVSPGGRFTSRGSLSSLPSSRQASYRMRANSRHRRAVDFSGIRRQSTVRRLYEPRGPGAPASIAGDETTYTRDFASPSSPHKKSRYRKKRAARGGPTDTQTNATKASDRHTVLNEEELRHFSTSIAKDCDEAFNSSLLSVPKLDEGVSREGSPLALSLGSATPSTLLNAAPVSTHPWDTRPLPPTPPSSSHNNKSAAPPSTYAENLAPPAAGRSSRPAQVALATPSPAERRVVSAPVQGQYGQYGVKAMAMLPSIYESSPERSQQDASKSRIVSAPPNPKVPAAIPTGSQESKSLHFLANAEQTIRIVHSPSSKRAAAAVATIKPLQIRKKSSIKVPDNDPARLPRGGSPEAEMQQPQQYAAHGQPRPELKKTSSQGSASTFAMRKKRSWFKRLSKESKESIGDDHDASQDGPQRAGSWSTEPNRTESTSTAPPPRPEPPAKKRSFIFPFWKSNKEEPRMSIAGPEYQDYLDYETQSAAKTRKTARQVDKDLKRDSKYSEESNDGVNRPKPRQNWLARLFRVKPASRVICLQISKRRARLEVATTLRNWRKHGMRDVVVDKERDIIYGKVGAMNYLDIKEVEFSCEIITVIEHGKRNHLSILRFTQERGAASSFHKVVDTLLTVLTQRNLLVVDPKKAKMMIKTLNS